MRLIFVMLLVLAAQAAAASPQDRSFERSKWEKYDGSERLGLMQEECRDEGWPKGYTARQAMGLLQKLSQAEGEKLMESCNPKDINLKGAQPAKVEYRVLDVVRPELKRVEHPFATIQKSKQYRCWIDAEGRHRVEDDDPEGTGWCFGKAVGDR